MNNFNNPYVDPYSFQGNHFNYNRNSTNSFNSHSSLTKQGGKEQKEPKQNADHTQNNIPKQHSIYTNGQMETITGSKPIIFSPPKLDSSQKYMLNDEHQDQFTGDKSNTQDEDSEKAERVSSLMKEFSYLLDDHDLPILEESSNHQDDTSDTESLAQLDEFSVESEDKNDRENQFPSKQETSKNLFDEFYSMLDESFDDSKTNQKEIEDLSEPVDIGEDTSLTMLSDINELEEEKQDTALTNLIETKEDLTTLEKSHTNLNYEENLLETEEKESSNAELPLSQDSKFSLQEKLYSKFKENSPSEDEFTLMLKEEKKEEDAQETASSNNKVDSSFLDKHAPTLEADSIEKETESNSINKSSLKKKKKKK